MAKSKNHTSHNQSRKNHKNGIKRIKEQKYSTLRGVDRKFKRNQRFAKAGNLSTAKQLKRAAANKKSA